MMCPKFAWWNLLNQHLRLTESVWLVNVLSCEFGGCLCGSWESDIIVYITIAFMFTTCWSNLLFAPFCWIISFETKLLAIHRNGTIFITKANKEIIHIFTWELFTAFYRQRWNEFISTKSKIELDENWSGSYLGLVHFMGAHYKVSFCHISHHGYLYKYTIHIRCFFLGAY